MAPKAKYGPWKDGKRFVWVDEAVYEEDERRLGRFTPVPPQPKARPNSPTPRNPPASHPKESTELEPEPASSTQDYREQRGRRERHGQPHSLSKGAAPTVTQSRISNDPLPTVSPDTRPNFQLAPSSLPHRHRSSNRHRTSDEFSEDGEPFPEHRPRRSTNSVQRSREEDQALTSSNTVDPRAKLSAVASAFIQINLSEFRDCRHFIERSPWVLQENTQPLLNYAIESHKLGRHQDVLKCIQGMLLIQECRDKQEDDRYEYLQRLIDKNRSVLRSFYEKSNAVVAAIRQSDTKESRLPRDTDAGRNVPNRRLSSSGGSSSKVVATASSASTDNFINARPNLNMVGGRTSGLPRHSTVSTARNASATDPLGLGRPFHVDSRPVPVGQVSLRGSRPRGGSNSTISNGQPIRLRTVELDEVQFRGTTPVIEKLDKLDPKYIKRKNAYDFFEIGRVFAILFHEHMGDGRKKKKSKYASDLDGQPKHVTEGPFGELIYSHIRRMVVIEKKRAYCWCIPINSYSGNGTAKKNFHPEELEAHAIIHDASKEPQLIAGERGLTKDPIAVLMARGQELDRASRLHFSKPYSVEYSAKTMDVGIIAPKSMAKFRGYCREEFRVLDT